MKAVETIDHCLERITEKILALDGQVLITADHGNCEQMIDPADGRSAHGAHHESGSDLLDRTRHRGAPPARRRSRRSGPDGTRPARSPRSARNDRKEPDRSRLARTAVPVEARMRGMLAALVDLLLPRACPLCGARGVGRASLLRRAVRWPSRGSIAAVASPARRTSKRRRSAARPVRESASPLAQIAAEAPFAGDVAQWVHRFKYPAPGLAGLDPRPGSRAHGARLATRRRRLVGDRPVLVVPVPIHPRKLRERGFHPAGELAQAVAAALGARDASVAPSARCERP